MNLSETLQEQKKQIQTIWVDRTLDSYTSSGFFKQSLDKIANPTGGNIRDGLSCIVDLLLDGADPEEYSKPLDQVIRIRAVQDFSPSQAIAFIFILKGVIRDEFKNGSRESPAWDDLVVIENRIDRMALLGDARERH